MITYKIKKVILTILTFLFSAICFVCLAFNNYTATAQTVTVSTDIQSLINDFNLSLSSNYGKATYVENYSTAYGDKVNGILLTIKAPSRGEGVSNGFYNSGVVKLNSIYNIKNMTGNENAIASVIFSVSEYPEEINEDTIILSNASIGMSEVNSYKGFDFTFENGLDSDYNYYDTIKKPEVSLGQRIYYENSLDCYIEAGVYRPSASLQNYGEKGRAPASLNGYTATPFSVYYDYKTNVTYKDVASLPKHQSNYTRLGQLLGVNPKNRTEIDNFNYEFFDYNATLKNYSGASTYKEFKGFEHGVANFTLSYTVKAGETATILFTSVMGLDLSSPLNSYDYGVLIDDNQTTASANYEILSPKYQTANGGEFSKTFSGVVNVYNGKRSYPYSYLAYGSAISSVTSDVGDAIYSSKLVGDKISLSNGIYLLEYIDNNGETAYVTLTVDAKPINATIETNSAFIKTKGVIGLSVKFKLPLSEYQQLENLKVVGVIATANFIDSLNLSFSDNLSYNYAKLENEYPTKIKTVEIAEWVEEVENEMTYKCFYLTLSNVKLQNYANEFYFGAYITTDDEIYCYADNDGNSFSKISVLTSSQSAYNNISTETGNYNYSAIINNVEYFSNVYTESEMQKVIKFYNYGLYLDAVSTVKVEGFVPYEYKNATYYYDSAKLNEVDAKRVIEYAVNVIGESN